MTNDAIWSRLFALSIGCLNLGFLALTIRGVRRVWKGDLDPLKGTMLALLGLGSLLFGHCPFQMGLGLFGFQ